MWQRLVNYMIFNLLAVSAILDPRLDMVLKWGSWLLLMASMRILCDLARSRFKALITYTPNAAWWIHGKIVTLLLILLCADFLVFYWSMHIRSEFTKDQLFLVFSECFSLFVVAIGALIKYGTYYVDNVYFSGTWEHRGSYSYYTDLFSKSIILMVSLIYYVTVLHLHGVSLNIFFDILIIIRLVVILVSLRTKFIAYQNYRQLSNHIANLYKPLSAEEIEEYNDDCAICRDPMLAALRLPCGHIFHTTCLRSWLEHNHNCPTCRFALIPQPNNTPPRNGSSSFNRAPIPSNQQSHQPQNPSQRATQRAGNSNSQNSHQNFVSQRQQNPPSPPTRERYPYLNTFQSAREGDTRANDPNRFANMENAIYRTRPPSRPSSPQRNASPSGRKVITSSSEATVRHEEMIGDNQGQTQSVWSISSPSWLAWLPSLSVEVVRGQDPGIGGMDQRDLTVHRENLEQVRAMFPDIPESVALADLIATQSLHDTINNIIENRLSWSPSQAQGGTNSSNQTNFESPAPTRAHTASSSSSSVSPIQPITFLHPTDNPCYACMVDSTDSSKFSSSSQSSSQASSSSHASTLQPSSTNQNSSLRQPQTVRPPNTPVSGAQNSQAPSSSSPASVASRNKLVQSAPSSPIRKTPSPATLESYADRKQAMIEKSRAAYLNKLSKNQ